MYLKSLSVLGFKSFADKTTLNFQPGVTAIVGPNGCGKSNVSDAIRWVLGEQSAKALRGGEMADVIFNGTDARKPLGMAEVSLTIGDVDMEQLKAAGVTIDFNEVTITRRVYRDGGSEYFVNKTSCRLRDLQQLFAGTGMGKSSYSVMAQGNITQILSSKPDDRRLVFEEAAGITKYKAQKKEALRKLEHTEQNLLRVQDLIKEVKRQIGSLQRQAGKARRYKGIAAELQHLETQLSRHQFDVLEAEIAERKTAAEALLVSMEASQAEVLRLEDEILRLRASLSELEQRISAGQRRGVELKAEIERHDGRIHFNKERLRELESQNARAIVDVTQADERRSIAEQELVTVKARLAESQERVNQLRVGLEEKRVALTTVERELSQKQEALRVAQSQSFGAAQQLSRSRNEINQLDLQKQGNLVRLEKLAAEKTTLEEESARLEARLTEFAAQVESEKLRVTTCRGTLEERQQRIRAIQTESQAAQQSLDGVLRRQAETRSRLNVLEQLDTQHEGFSSGSLAALRLSQEVIGSLADKIRVPDEHVVAIEAALGHHLQLVLTEQPDAALKILNDLSTQKKGRASIAALALPVAAEADAALETLPEGAKSALSVIATEDRYLPLLRAFLGRTLVVADLPAATAAFRETGGRFDFVTAQGDLLSRSGIYTGGSANNSGKAPASILGRKNQIAELQAEQARLAGQVADASRHKGALQSELTALQASLEEARTELRSQEVAIATRQGEFNALQNSRRSLSQKAETVAHEFKMITGHEAVGTEKRNRLVTQIADFEAREKAASELVVQLSADLEELRRKRDAANAALSDAKVSMATEEQLLASHGRQRPPLEARIRELVTLSERLRAEMSTFDGKKAQFDGEIQVSQHEIERLTHERETASQLVAALLAEQGNFQREISSREESLKESRTRLAASQNRKGQLEVELAQKTMTVENLRLRIREKYQLELEQIRGEGITITLADEGQPKIESIPLEAMAAAGLTTDWNTVSEQVAHLQKKIDDIGPVNLVAIEEFEETEQRYGFLNAQHDDLQQGKKQLVEIIGKINSETRAMFIETFEKIRDNFRVLFVEVFGGGKADLQLIEGEDVLEAGIEIMARPPGKQLQSISLLSGGEQTMTAVALLFSIYQVKPSPFCVLDELDAPLDESNINRFVKVLKRFINHSQFIVITHNKRTIGMADVLYGVTMQEQGVSKIVSVRFNREDGAPESNTQATPLHETVRDDSPVAVAPVLDSRGGPAATSGEASEPPVVAEGNEEGQPSAEDRPSAPELSAPRVEISAAADASEAPNEGSDDSGVSMAK
jgi:chromosome segregation protein